MRDVHDSRGAEPSAAASFVHRVLIVAAVAALALLVWRLAPVFVLLFAGIVLAMVLRALSEPIAARSGLRQRWALAIVVAALVAAVAGAAWLFGDRVAQQFTLILERLPQAWDRLRQWLGQSEVGRYLLDLLVAMFAGANNQPGHLAGFAKTTFGALADAAVIIVIALYLAAEPGLYRRGFVKLVPPRARPRADATLDAMVAALKRWLLGQSLAMLWIGVVTGVGLWALGIPMALALAILAGLLEFVPYVGPFVAAIPALLLAFAQSPLDALYVLLLYIAVQEVENWLIVPLIQKWSVKLPPVLTILSVVVFGLLFGVLGILVATPLVIVVMVAVQKLYVEGVLGEQE
jgi:predicted PurR-regulated permease PerM